jgi:hypothetical protein
MSWNSEETKNQRSGGVDPGKWKWNSKRMVNRDCIALSPSILPLYIHHCLGNTVLSYLLESLPYFLLFHIPLFLACQRAFISRV